MLPSVLRYEVYSNKFNIIFREKIRVYCFSWLKYTFKVNKSYILDKLVFCQKKVIDTFYQLLEI